MDGALDWIGLERSTHLRTADLEALTGGPPSKKQVSRPDRAWWFGGGGSASLAVAFGDWRSIIIVIDRFAPYSSLHTITNTTTTSSTSSPLLSTIKLTANLLQATADFAHARNHRARQDSPPTLALHRPPWIGYRECWLRPKDLAAVEAHLNR